MRFIFIIIILIPQLLFAQNAPIAHFGASNSAVCDSIYNENFTDQSTNNPTSWKWYFPGAMPDTSTLQNPTNIKYTGYGCYTVKLVVKNNYGVDSLTDSNYICLDAPPNITLTGDLGVCLASGRLVDTITAHGGTSYYWYTNGDTTANFIFNPGGTFYIKVRVSNGACSKDSGFYLAFDTMPSAAFRGNTSICVGSNTTIYAFSISHYEYHYLWSNGSTTDSITVNGTQVGSYTYNLILYRPGGGCEDSGQVTVKVNDCTGIEDYSNPSGISIYPNPSNGQFTLVIASEAKQSNSVIQIYNVLGQQVYKANINSNTTEINLSGQPQGVYLYRVISQNGSLVGEGKLIIQK